MKKLSILVFFSVLFLIPSQVFAQEDEQFDAAIDISSFQQWTVEERKQRLGDIIEVPLENQEKIIFELMLAKNHDYGEAWRDMRVSSLTDLILQKLMRVKQIEANSGKTIISEGIEANYHDIVNYAVFALIHLNDFH